MMPFLQLAAEKKASFLVGICFHFRSFAFHKGFIMFQVISYVVQNPHFPKIKIILNLKLHNGYCHIQHIDCDNIFYQTSRKLVDFESEFLSDVFKKSQKNSATQYLVPTQDVIKILNEFISDIREIVLQFTSRTTDAQ